MRCRALVAVLLAALPVSPAFAADDIAGDAVKHASCQALYVSTVGVPELFPPASVPDLGVPIGRPSSVPLPSSVELRSLRETFNGRHEFVLRRGQIHYRPRDGGDVWRLLPLPACFDGDVAAISADDDELVALDSARRIFTMDGALGDPLLFSWSGRWGPPVWTGFGRQIPAGLDWDWSVISPQLDGTWTDPAGNRHRVGDGKVSHVYLLRRGGRRITFMDPWLPIDQSYEVCGPRRGTLRSSAIAVSGSTVMLAGADGRIYTRLYDFDISGHNSVFFQYSYEDQRAITNPAIQLPAERWVRQPQIPGRFTDAISIHKTGRSTTHRVMRVPGWDRRERSGYWERDIADPPGSGWEFVRTGRRVNGKNPARAFRRPFGRRPFDFSFAGENEGMRITVPDFNVYCSPARLIVREPSRPARRYRLHNVDGLRQASRAAGLDDRPRLQNGAIEAPPGTFGPTRFTEVGLEITRSTLRIPDLAWTLHRRP